MLRQQRRHFALAIALPALLAAALAAQSRPVVTGPDAGALVIVGGGRVGPEILNRFLELAGGKEAPIVVIPTAGGADEYAADWNGLNLFKNVGATNLTILHTNDKAEADTEAFVKPLLSARGVWFPGGRQWRLVDSYLHTRTHREIENVLTRGGVVGGTSAGATIIGSYLVRGAREGNTIMMAPGYEEGMGFLTNAAIDQHLLARNRHDDLVPVIEKHPHLLGIGLDESTAIVVQGTTFEVVGASKVAIYDNETSRQRNGKKYFFMSPGERYDLAKLERMR